MLAEHHIDCSDIINSWEHAVEEDAVRGCESTTLCCYARHAAAHRPWVEFLSALGQNITWGARCTHVLNGQNNCAVESLDGDATARDNVIWSEVKDVHQGERVHPKHSQEVCCQSEQCALARTLRSCIV
jgi:hypothetical protein